jgi:hypothetical protein
VVVSETLSWPAAILLLFALLSFGIGAQQYMAA